MCTDYLHAYWIPLDMLCTQVRGIENDYGTERGDLYKHLYVQVACTLEMSWKLFNPCIYAFLPFELAVFV